MHSKFHLQMIPGSAPPMVIKMERFVFSSPWSMSGSDADIDVQDAPAVGDTRPSAPHETRRDGDDEEEIYDPDDYDEDAPIGPSRHGSRKEEPERKRSVSMMTQSCLGCA